jgi:cytochrome c553
MNCIKHRVAHTVSVILSTWILCGDALAQAPNASVDDAAKTIAATVCVSCHGVEGTGTSPVFPRLAGQSEIYLAAQLRAFKTKARGDKDAHDYMWGMATLLEEPMIDALARHYAAQKPAPGIAGDPTLIAIGKTVFENGIPAQGIAACSQCHGSKAEGQSIFPRLASQRAAYVVRQIDAIQKQSRESPVMHGVIKEMDPKSIKAVAEYVQSL